MCNITFKVPRLSTFVFKKSLEKKIFTIIFVLKSLMGFGWINAGPASQTMAQHYFTIGPVYRVIWVVAFRGIKRHTCFNVGPASNIPVRLTGIETAMGCDACPTFCDACPTLNRYWVGRPTLYVPDAYTDLSAMVVERIGRARWRYTCLLGSFANYILDIQDSGPWEKPIQLCLQIIKPIFCLKDSNRLKPGLGVWELLL